MKKVVKITLVLGIFVLKEFEARRQIFTLTYVR